VTAWRSEEGGFQLELPEDSTVTVFEDSESFLAVSFAAGEWRALVQRFRAAPHEIGSAEEFDAVLDGVLLGLEEALRPMKVLERRREGRFPRLRADLVLRGRSSGSDVMQRRRLQLEGPVPPGALFLLTASVPADRFLVHRRLFEELFESFGYEP
jgi:hypothetical protein